MAISTSQTDASGLGTNAPYRGPRRGKSKGRKGGRPVQQLSNNQLEHKLVSRRSGILTRYSATLELMKAQGQSLPAEQHKLLYAPVEEVVALYSRRSQNNERRALLKIVKKLSYKGPVEDLLKQRKSELRHNGQLAT